MSARRISRAVVVVVAGLVLASCQWGLGGPNNTFGNDPTSGGQQAGVSASIAGPFSRHQDGDPYATKCAGKNLTSTSCDGAGSNPTYDPGGYTWIVNVPTADVGNPIAVQIYDPSISDTGAPLFENTNGPPSSDFHTSFDMFDTTGDINNVSLDPSLSLKGKCQQGPGQQTFGVGTSAGAPDYFEHWFVLCTLVPTRAGFYPLQVKTSSIAGVPDAGTGWNAYSVKALSATTTQPQVFALNELSMLTTSNPSSFYLANIGTQLAGHTMTVDVFDPGDGSNSGSSPFTLQVLAPPSGLAAGPSRGTSIPCMYSSAGSLQLGATVDASSFNCTIATQAAFSTAAGHYNDRWLQVQIVIPASYSCTTDCWWSIRENFGNANPVPNDHLVAVVNVSASVAS